MLSRDLTEIIRILDKSQAILENITFMSCYLDWNSISFDFNNIQKFLSDFFTSFTETYFLHRYVQVFPIFTVLAKNPSQNLLDDCEA